jgi:hypothetical protein
MRHPLHHLKNKSPVLVPGFSDCAQSLPDLIVIPNQISFPRRRESSLFQSGMDSGSALRFARNDGFDQSPGLSHQPTPDC